MRFWGFIIALGLIFVGGTGLWQAMTVGEQRTVTVEELVAGVPEEGWYRITGAEWNELDTLYQENDDTGRIQSGGMLALVRPAGSDPMAATKLLLQQDSSQVASRIASVQPLQALVQLGDSYIMLQDAQGEEVDPARLESAIDAAAQLEAIYAEHDRSGELVGLVSTSVPSGFSRSEVVSLGEGAIHPDFVTIDTDWEPSLGEPLGMLGGGIVLLLLVGAFTLGRGGPRDELD